MRDNQAKLLAALEELRRCVGPDVPVGQLLRLTAYISKVATTDQDELQGFGRPGEARALIALPLDDAMSDGGWRILAFERASECGVDRLDSDELEHLKPRPQWILRPEWQH